MFAHRFFVVNRLGFQIQMSTHFLSEDTVAKGSDEDIEKHVFTLNLNCIYLWPLTAMFTLDGCEREGSLNPLKVLAAYSFQVHLLSSLSKYYKERKTNCWMLFQFVPLYSTCPKTCMIVFIHILKMVICSSLRHFLISFFS